MIIRKSKLHSYQVDMKVDKTPQRYVVFSDTIKHAIDNAEILARVDCLGEFVNSRLTAISPSSVEILSIKRVFTPEVGK